MIAFIALAALMAAQITVVDGDTVRVGEQSWRLLGFDTPETGHARCEAEYRLGLRAKERLASLIENAESVEIEDAGKLDKYQRKLAKSGMLKWENATATAIVKPLVKPATGEDVK